MSLAKQLIEALSPRSFSVSELQALARKYGANLKTSGSTYELNLPWKYDRKVVTMVTFMAEGSGVEFKSLVIHGLDRLGAREAYLKTFAGYLQDLNSYLNVVRSLVLELLKEGK